MVPENSEDIKKQVVKIPLIKAESETQTSGQLVSLSPDSIKVVEMDASQQTQSMSIRKRRNLSKNRGLATRQREKTPDPGRNIVPHEDTTTSDDEETNSPRNSREIEADNTYEEMKRLVQEKATDKDPVYDIDTTEILEARAAIANERRRRSISPFAIPSASGKEELPSGLERKGSFIDPTNKLLSATYTLSPKDEGSSRRNSLTIEPPKERKDSLTSQSSSASPKDKSNFNFSSPITPKKQEPIVYLDENRITTEDSSKKKVSTPVLKEKTDVFTFDKKDEKPKLITKCQTTKAVESESGELVTKIIQVERTPSKKLVQENKPNVEIRSRIVRTPSRKAIPSETKPSVTKDLKQNVKDEPQSKVPVKPVRSKSATRFGGKTSESEMSEDQGKAHNDNPIAAPRRKVAPTPRRFLKNKSDRPIRSQSVNRVEDLENNGPKMSQTSKDIIELMQTRARSLSIPKDDPQLPNEYKKDSNKVVMTPKKVSSLPRGTRGVSCPKTIQIISDKEILSSLLPKSDSAISMTPKGAGYIDASQSEYTSSCYSSSPSENEFEFDLYERTAELTRKLNLLSQQVDKKLLNLNENEPKIIREKVEEKSVVRKRTSAAVKPEVKQETKIEEKTLNKTVSSNRDKKDAPDTHTTKDKPKKPKSKWRFFGVRDNWAEFVEEKRQEYNVIIALRNRCICDFIMLIVMCGLGGLMFKSLEGSFENAYKCGTRNVKRDFIESLWRGSSYMREEEWKSMARKKLFEFENQLHNAHEAGVTSYSGQKSWNFMNSFVYCLTLITTIGYGHIAPKTTSGRVATIVYAIVGIPLFLIVLADFGKLFTRIIKFFWSFIRRFYFTRSCRKVRRTVPVQEVMKGLNIVYDVVRRPSQIFTEEDINAAPNGEGDSPTETDRKLSLDLPPPLPPKPNTIRDPELETEPDTPAPSVFEIDDEFNLPISVATFILVGYIIVGAFSYTLWESWSFFESFYFVFISMSTIGLGDLVPDHPMFMMASILYLVFGLALTSMCINVVQEKLSDTFKQASAKIGATVGLRVAEEDGSLVPITPGPTEAVPVHKPNRTEDVEKQIEKLTEKLEGDADKKDS